jgi:hypothetical protein
MTMVAIRHSSFGTNCVQCSNDLIAPERSEYWSDGHACHVWHCPRCSCCFESLVLFEADSMSIQESMTGSGGHSVGNLPLRV